MKTWELIDRVEEIEKYAADAYLYFYNEKHEDPVFETSTRENGLVTNFADRRIYDYRNQCHLIMIMSDKTAQVYRNGYDPRRYEWRKIFDQKDYSKDAQYQKAIDLAIKLSKIKAETVRAYYDDDSIYTFTTTIYNRIIHRVNTINKLLCEYFATTQERETISLSTDPQFRLWTDLHMTSDKWRCVFDNSKKDFHAKLQLQVEELFVPVLLRIV